MESQTGNDYYFVIPDDVSQYNIEQGYFEMTWKWALLIVTSVPETREEIRTRVCRWGRVLLMQGTGHL